MKEQISALIDGALDEEEGSSALDALGRSASLREDWRRYCLIGDCLRGEAASPRDLSSAVMVRLNDGPTVLAPAALQAPGSLSRIQRPLAMAAAVMGVALVAWAALRSPIPTSEPQLAGSARAGVQTAKAVTHRESRASAKQVRHDYLGSQSTPETGGYLRTQTDPSEDAGK